MDPEDERIEAKCMDMCPEAERSQRERNGLIHILETDPTHEGKSRKANSSRMIKSYNRSAAGQVLTKPESLRPPVILLKTLTYIFNEVITDNRVSKVALYNFIDDRLRSVKQDCIVQRISNEDWFRILPPIIYFYVYSSYWLCEEPLNNFDPKLNKDQLIDCLTRIIKIHETNVVLGDPRLHAEMEALYLILNADKMDVINRAVALNLTEELFKKTLQVVLKFYARNIIGVLKELCNLPLMPHCLFITLHLATLRKYWLQVMSVAYGTKTGTDYPLTKIKSDLLFNSIEETVNDCLFYGLDIDQTRTNVKFTKKVLNTGKATSRKLQTVDENVTTFSISEFIRQHNKEETKS